MEKSHHGDATFGSMRSFMTSLIQGGKAVSNQVDGDKFTVDIVDDNAKLDLGLHRGNRSTQSLMAMMRNPSENRQLLRWENHHVPDRASDIALFSSHTGPRLSHPDLLSSSNMRNLFHKSTSESMLMPMPMRTESPRFTSKTVAISDPPDKKATGNASRAPHKKTSGNATWAPADVAPTTQPKLFDLALSLSRTRQDSAVLLPQRRTYKQTHEPELGPSPPTRKKSWVEVDLEEETSGVPVVDHISRRNDTSSATGQQVKPRSVSPNRNSRDSDGRSLSSSDHTSNRTMERMRRKSRPALGSASNGPRGERNSAKATG